MDNIKLWARHSCRPEMLKAAVQRFHQLHLSYLESAFYSSLVLLTIFWASLAAARRFQARKTLSRPRTPDLEKPLYSSKFKAPSRGPGGMNSPSQQTLGLLYMYNCDSCVTLLNISQQCGYPEPSSAPPHHLTQIGLLRAPSRSLTARSVTAQSTTSPWAYERCTGTTGLSLTTIFSNFTT